MEAQAYMLVFEGELAEGFELEQVKQSLRELFSLSQEKIEEMFSLPKVVMKRNLDHGSAQVFQTQLHKHGLVTSIQPMESTGQGTSPLKTASKADGASVVGGEPTQFEFLGKGGEYFKIWIVNILLSIITLGIYSAWAKVRNHRYFYSNTRLGGHTFEYTANPIAILKGRLIAALFFAVYVLGGQFMPILNLIFMPIFLVVFPWLVVKSLGFRNRNTAYRNIRFGFDGNYGNALLTFIVWPLLGVVTFGLLFPMAIQKQKTFIVGYSRYGTTRFNAGFGVKDFYMIFLGALGLFILGALLLGFVGAMLGLPEIAQPFLILPVYLFAFAYVNARTANLIYNNSRLLEHGFDSRIEVGRLAWIYFSNAVVVGITLGLATPWAKVRLATYHAACLRFIAVGSVDDFIAREEQNVNALGEEIGDVFDLDIGL